MRKVILLLMLIGSYVYGHDLWLEKKGSEYILYYGHLHSSHEGKNIIRYNPDVIKSAVCIDSSGNRTDLTFKKEYPIKLRSDCSILYVVLKPQHWTKTPYGTVNKKKDVVKMPITSWISHEGVKRIDNWNQNLQKPFVEGLDIIPVNNPFELDVGDKLRLLITFNGKPVEDVAVAYDGRFRGMTDSNGRINVRVKHPGLQTVEATYRIKINSDTVDEVLYTLILNFEIKKR
ncbi:DUF4198 domain-containing protein [Persephonella sp.]